MKTDASDYALAAILSIITKNNEIHPIAFYSQTFSALKLNYNVHDKELLAIFEAFKIWRHYLEGSAVTPQANFLQKITFDIHYTNRFTIKIRSRTLSIFLERNTI